VVALNIPILFLDSYDAEYGVHKCNLKILISDKQRANVSSSNGK
jgi:hypothetical protein